MLVLEMEMTMLSMPRLIAAQRFCLQLRLNEVDYKDTPVHTPTHLHQADCEVMTGFKRSNPLEYE
jgi:hypothetical protein